MSKGFGLHSGLLRSSRFVAILFIALLPALGLAATGSGNPLIDSLVNEAAALISSARNIIIADYNEIKALKKNRSEVTKVQKQLQDNVNTADKLNDQNIAALTQALADQYALQTKGLVIPAMGTFDAAMIDYMQPYKEQAGLPFAPDLPGVTPVPGIWKFRREAMGEIIDSTPDSLASLLYDVIKHASDNSKTLSADLRAISAGKSPSLTEFGFNHYLDNAIAKMHGEIDLVNAISPILNGKTMTGQASAPLLACLPFPQAYSTFVEDLNTVKNLLPTGPIESDPTADSKQWNDYKKAVTETILYNYDGCPTCQPGLISHWGGCIQSLNDRITITKNSQDIARSEGNLSLAAQLDNEIQQYLREIEVRQNELATIHYRRDQIGQRILTAAGRQVNSSNDRGAWRQTVIEHANDLIALVDPAGTSKQILNPVYQAEIDVVNRGINELPPLALPMSPQDLSDALLSTASKIDSIRVDGFDRLNTEIDFSISTFGILARDIRIGESPLLFSMDTYEHVLQLQLIERQKDLQELPSLLTQAAQSVASAQKTYADSVGFLKDANAKLADFLPLVGRLDKQTSLLDKLLSRSKLNPIYTDLSSQLFEPFQSQSAYLKIKRSLDVALRKMLTAFPGLSAPKKPVAKLARARTALARAVAKRRKLLVKSIGVYVDQASRAQLGGQALSEALAEVDVLNSQAMSFGH